MLDDLLNRVLVRIAPGFVPGPALHRRALAAHAAGRPREAEALFDAAARSYRHELQVEPLARLRVHQRLVRARACGDPEREAELMLDIVRSLNKLDQLESLRAPFALRDARTVLSEWLSEGVPARDDASLARAS